MPRRGTKDDETPDDVKNVMRKRSSQEEGSYGSTDLPKSGRKSVRRSSIETIARDSLYATYLSDHGSRNSKEQLIEREGISTFGATITMSKQMFGCGILSFAATAWSGGLLSCIFLLPLSGCISMYTAVLLVWTIDALEKKYPNIKLHSYEDIMGGVFGDKAYMAMKIVFNVSLFFIATMYISIPAQYMSKLFPYTLNPVIWTLLFAIYYVPLAWLNDLSIISKVAVGGVFCVFIAIIVMIIGAIRYWQSDLRDSGDLESGAPWWPKNDFPEGSEAAEQDESPVIKFLQSFSTWAFGYGAILITASTRLQMKKPKEVMTAVVNSHLIVSIVYIMMVLPMLFGFTNAVVWSGNLVDLMNTPIKAPIQNPDTQKFAPWGKWINWGPDKNLQPPDDAHENPIVIMPDGKEVPNPFLTKSWEAYVITFCTIISVSITFPLIVRILTRMGEQTFEVLNKSKVMQIIWRTILVCICIGCGLLLGSIDKFNPTLGMISSLFMVPIQFMLPIVMYFGIMCKVAGSAGQAVAKIGIFQVISMVVIQICACVFMGTGIYGSGKAFAE